MARVTIEDCLTKVANRFELVVLAAQRSRELAFGAAPLLPKNNDKYAVIALREIAASLLSVEVLRDSVIKRNQRKQLLHIEDQPEQVDAATESAYQQEMAAFASAPRKKSASTEDSYSDEDESDEEVTG